MDRPFFRFLGKPLVRHQSRVKFFAAGQYVPFSSLHIGPQAA
jgi:hypothetical protein